MDNTESLPQGPMDEAPKFESASQEEIYNCALRVLHGHSESNPLNTGELVERVKSSLSDDAARNKAVYYELLGLTRLDGSLLSSKQGRGGGYFLASGAASARDEAPSGRGVDQAEKTLEKHLWPVAATWLVDSQIVSRASAEFANIKKGGKWGNPDVVGLNIVDELGFFDVEVVTLEVKPSYYDWERFFFEAVSHRRFANRSYFVFRSSSELASEERLKMLEFSRKFSVGLVELQIDGGEYRELPGWETLSDSRKAEIINRFVEHYPAPIMHVPMRDKVDFLRRLGINGRSQIFEFGRKD